MSSAEAVPYPSAAAAAREADPASVSAAAVAAPAAEAGAIDRQASASVRASRRARSIMGRQPNGTNQYVCDSGVVSGIA